MGRQFDGSTRQLAAGLFPPPAVPFVYRHAASPAFKDLFREGMALVEEAAAYLDGPGKRNRARSPARPPSPMRPKACA